MKFAFVGPFGFHPNKTMRSRALPIARALVAMGHSVHLIMPPWHTPEEQGRTWHEDGVKITTVRVDRGLIDIVRGLVRETDQTRPDAIVTFKPKAYSGFVMWLFWYRFWETRPTLICDTDDWEGPGGWNDVAPYTPLQKIVFTWQERWGYRHCHILTVASRALEAKAAELKVPSGRVLYLPNGTGISASKPDPNDVLARRTQLGLIDYPTIVLYSRLFEFDTDRLIDLLAGVFDGVPDLHILSIGTGLYDSDQTRLRDGFESIGLLDRVIDVGWLEEADLPATLSSADVALYLMDDTLLNRTKCPVKLADLCTMGCPVVGEAVGQVKEYVVQGKTGFLRPSGDVDGLIEDTITLLRDKTLRSEFGSAAREHALSQFSWDVQASALVAKIEAQP